MKLNKFLFIMLIPMYLMGNSMIPIISYLLSDSETSKNPVAIAGDDVAVEIGTLVALDGSASLRASGYSWHFVDKPKESEAFFSDAKSASPVFVADVEGSYTIALVVSDGKTNSVADTINTVASFCKDEGASQEIIPTLTDPTGTIVDASGVTGLRVVCGAQESYSVADGAFECNQFPMSVYAGTFKLGEIAELPASGMVFTQDLVGVILGATTYPEVSKISMILQSLDEDANVENGIVLTSKSIEILNKYLSTDSILEEIAFEEIAIIIEDVIKSRLEQKSTVLLRAVDRATAQSNLTEMTAKNAHRVTQGPNDETE